MKNFLFRKTGKFLLMATLVLFAKKSGAVTINATVAKDGSGNYTTVQAAFDAAPSNSSTRWVIYIKNGTYKQVVTLASNKTNITIIGESRDGVFLTYDNAANKTDPSTGSTFGTSGSSSTYIKAAGFYAVNVTFQNTAGTAYGPSLAMYLSGDKAVFNNCRFISNQDTYYGAYCRQYFLNCYFEGTTDFIFGPSTAFYQSCSIYTKGGSAITAASTESYVTYGYVFQNCTVTGSGAAITDLGRPWRPYAAVAFLNCSLSGAIKSTGWNDWGNSANQATARFGEYNNTGSGSSMSGRPSWVKRITSSEAASYTMTNVLKTTYTNPVTTDNWIPTDVINATSLSATLTKHGAGSSSQTVSLGNAITSFYYSWENATGASTSGLPSGVTATVSTSAKTITISGTPTVTGTYNYTITTTGGSPNATKSGTITVSSAKSAVIANSNNEPSALEIGDIIAMPGTKTVSVKVKLAENSMVYATLYTVAGVKVANLVKANYEKGENTFTFNTSAYKQGIYIISFAVNGQIKNQKFINN